VIGSGARAFHSGEPIHRVGSGLEVIRSLGQAQRRHELRRSGGPVPEGGQGVSGVDPDPKVIRPGVQVGRDPGSCLFVLARFGQRDPDIGLVEGLVVAVDTGQGGGLFAETGPAQIENHVHDPVGQPGHIRRRAQGHGQVLGAAGKPARRLNEGLGPGP
jgi:hypothetical protein